MRPNLHTQLASCSEQTGSKPVRCHECHALIPPSRKHVLLIWNNPKDLATACCRDCHRLWELAGEFFANDLPEPGGLRKCYLEADYDCNFLLDLSEEMLQRILVGEFDLLPLPAAKPICLLEVCSELGDTVHVQLLETLQQAQRYFRELFQPKTSQEYVPFYFYLPAAGAMSRCELLKKPEWD